MRDNYSSCILRCTLADDIMFRNSKQFSSSPSLCDAAGSFKPSDAALFAVQGRAADQPLGNPLHEESSSLPQCRQFMDIIGMQSRCLSGKTQDNGVASHLRGSRSIAEVHECAAASIAMVVEGVGAGNSMEYIDSAMRREDGAPLKEIREYDFLRCIEEGPRTVLAHGDMVDCTLHLGTTPARMDDGRGTMGGPSIISLRESSSTSDHIARAVSCKLQPALRDRDIARGAAWNAAIQLGSDLAQLPNFADGKEYNVGPLAWSSMGRSTAIVRRAETGGALTGMPTSLLRENAHDQYIEECGSSSRTSSNSSGNTLKAATTESSILRTAAGTYARPGDQLRDNCAGPAAPSSFHGTKQWLHYLDHQRISLAAEALGTRTRPSSLRGNDPYSHLAAASVSGRQGGPFTPQVFSGVSKGSNSKEASNNYIRICAQCKTMRTPLWRNGPQGPKSLCNACGIRYKKEERRSASAALEDSKQEADQRSRSSMDPTDDRRPIMAVEDQRSRFINEHRRPRLMSTERLGDKMSSKEASEDERSRFVENSTDERSRYLAARSEKRPKIGDSYNR